MVYENIKKLVGKIAECGYTRKTFAEALGMSEVTLRRKMFDAKAEFTTSEILLIKDLLNLTIEEFELIFFNINLN